MRLTFIDASVIPAVDLLFGLSIHMSLLSAPSDNLNCCL